MSAGATQPTTTTPPGSFDPSQLFNSPDLTTAQNAYSTAETAATTSQAADQTLPYMLQQALTAKFTNANPLIQTREADLTNYMDALSNAKNDVGPDQQGGIVLDPNQQQDLINKRINASAAPLSTDNLILGLTTGGMTNIINATAAAHAADTQKLLGQATLAQQNYKDVLDELSSKAQMAISAAQLAEQQRQYNLEYQAKYGVNPDTGAQSPLLQLLSGNQNNQSGTTSTNSTGGQDQLAKDRGTYKAAMALYAGNPTMTQQISDMWKAKYGNTPLNQQSLGNQDEADVQLGSTLTSDISQIKKLIAKNPNLIGSGESILGNYLGNVPFAQKIVSPDEQQLVNLVGKVQKDTKGSLSPLMGQLLSEALSSTADGQAPSVMDNPKNFNAKLDLILNAIKQGMSTIASNNGYTDTTGNPDYTILPGYTPQFLPLGKNGKKVGTVDILSAPSMRNQGYQIGGF